MAGRTSFVIARTSAARRCPLSTVRPATRILVLEHDQLLEQGTHAQLLDADDRYSGLYRLGLTWDD
jgi:ABC-type multidrug transport system fused ATPase/permease subunit